MQIIYRSPFSIIISGPLWPSNSVIPIDINMTLDIINPLEEGLNFTEGGGMCNRLAHVRKGERFLVRVRMWGTSQYVSGRGSLVSATAAALLHFLVFASFYRTCRNDGPPFFFLEGLICPLHVRRRGEGRGTHLLLHLSGWRCVQAIGTCQAGGRIKILCRKEVISSDLGKLFYSSRDIL
jgi:hypothetical protein